MNFCLVINGSVFYCKNFLGIKYPLIPFRVLSYLKIMEINFQGDVLQNVISIEIKLSKQGIIVDKQKFASCRIVKH